MNAINSKTSGVTPRFDFFAKLCQPDMVGTLRRYVTWQKAVRAALAAGERLPQFPQGVMPLSINLDLTTACNFACTHCIDLEVLNTGVKHDYLEESLRQLIAGGLRSVIIIGGGEPTLERSFVPVVKLLKDAGIQVAVVTNGTRPEKLVEIAPLLTEGDWIRYSLDSGTNETFVAMHLPKGKMRSAVSGQMVEISLQEICAWVPKVRAANQAVPVNFSYICTWPGAEQYNGEDMVDVIDNIDEIVPAAQLAKESGFGEISIKAYLSRADSGAEVMDTSAIEHRDGTLARIETEVLRAQREISDGTFRVVVSTNLQVLLDGTWSQYQKQPQRCHMIALRGVVSPLGYFNCPAHRGEEKAKISHKNAFGHPDWTQEALVRTGNMVEQFDARHECEAVTCLYNPTNWVIEQVISGELNLDDLISGLPDVGSNRFL